MHQHVKKHEGYRHAVKYPNTNQSNIIAYFEWVLTVSGAQPSETSFNFSSSTSVVLDILLTSGTVHILLPKDPN